MARYQEEGGVWGKVDEIINFPVETMGINGSIFSSSWPDSRCLFNGRIRRLSMDCLIKILNFKK